MRHYSHTPTARSTGLLLLLPNNVKILKLLQIRWLVTRELAEYGIIFADGEEGTWLDKVDSRYNWLKRHLGRNSIESQ